MGELGVFSEEGHVLVGRTAEELRLDCVVSVGTDAARITDAISPNSFTQRLNFSSAEEAAEWLRSHTAPEDIVFEDKGVKVVVDGKSLQFLDGTQLDFVKEGLNEGFKFTNPNVKDECGCGESFHV